MIYDYSNPIESDITISYNINQSVLASRHLKMLLNYVLQMLVNKSIDMAKQLYYSEIHSKNIEIYLSKLYNGTYYEFDDVIKYTQKPL